ncbi:DNA-binding protein [Streptococcus pneumoniae]|nr:DNA-binding protein [Streptococcus pneumoniae]
MREVIQELLDSSMSTSAISQGAGVPWTTVSDLRKGKTSMDKMAFLVIIPCHSSSLFFKKTLF